MVDITALPGVAGVAPQGVQKSSATIQAAIATLLSGQPQGNSPDAVSVLSAAAQLQSQTVVLKQASGNLAQASSLAEVAASGVAQIEDILNQQRALAQQANSPTANAGNRADLNQKFQQLTGELNAIVSDTQFSGKSLLDGSLSGNNSVSLGGLLSAEGLSGGGNSLSIDNLSSSALFSGQSLDVLSSDSAQQALSTIGEAFDQVSSVAADIGSFQQANNFAAANIDSAVANQEAAASSLPEGDVTPNTSALTQTYIQNNGAIAVDVQTKRLAPSMLELLN